MNAETAADISPKTIFFAQSGNFELKFFAQQLFYVAHRAICPPDLASCCGQVIGDCLSALRCLHSMHVTHRDLKPENLMYASDDPNDPKYEDIKVRQPELQQHPQHEGFHHCLCDGYSQLQVCDLGLAGKTDSSSDMMTTLCGTPGYMAPELLQELPYDPKADVFSVGVILYWMLSDQLPFNQVCTLFDLAKNAEKSSIPY